MHQDNSIEVFRVTSAYHELDTVSKLRVLLKLQDWVYDEIRKTNAFLSTSTHLESLSIPSDPEAPEAPEKPGPIPTPPSENKALYKQKETPLRRFLGKLGI